MTPKLLDNPDTGNHGKLIVLTDGNVYNGNDFTTDSGQRISPR